MPNLDQRSPPSRIIAGHQGASREAAALYGGATAWLGWRLARGQPKSREAALIGGAVATVFLPVAEIVFYAGPTDLFLFAILDVLALSAYGLVFYWLRKPPTA